MSHLTTRPRGEGRVVYGPSKNYPRTDKLKTVRKKEPRTWYRNKKNRPSRGCSVMSVQRSSPPGSLRRRAALFVTNFKASNETLLIINIVNIVESSEFYSYDTTSLDSSQLQGACLNHNDKNSRQEQAKKITSFVPTQNSNFHYWRYRKEGRNK